MCERVYREISTNYSQRAYNVVARDLIRMDAVQDLKTFRSVLCSKNAVVWTAFQYSRTKPQRRHCVQVEEWIKMVYKLHEA
jgi:hypothetical protein